jgi:hypothetical protein
MVKALLSFSPGAWGHDDKTVSYGPKVETIKVSNVNVIIIIIIFN